MKSMRTTAAHRWILCFDGCIFCIRTTSRMVHPPCDSCDYSDGRARGVLKISMTTLMLSLATGLDIRCCADISLFPCSPAGAMSQWTGLGSITAPMAGEPRRQTGVMRELLGHGRRNHLVPLAGDHNRGLTGVSGRTLRRWSSSIACTFFGGRKHCWR
jgi:hypothetical protein